MITLSIARHQLGKHVSMTTDAQATIKDVAGSDIFYVVHAEAT
jgi:hypothetical protein